MLLEDLNLELSKIKKIRIIHDTDLMFLMGELVGRSMFTNKEVIIAPYIKADEYVDFDNCVLIEVIDLDEHEELLEEIIVDRDDSKPLSEVLIKELPKRFDIKTTKPDVTLVVRPHGYETVVTVHCKPKFSRNETLKENGSITFNYG